MKMKRVLPTSPTQTSPSNNYLLSWPTTASTEHRFYRLKKLTPFETP